MKVSPGRPPAPQAEVLWRLGDACNFACSYCSRASLGRDGGAARLDAERVAAGFDGTGRRWRIHLTGGEPFLHPDVLPVTEALARRHVLSVNTNLSTANVMELAERVPAASVHSVNASLHVAERERRAGALERFLERFLALQAGGFRIRLFYVASPELLPRMERDLAACRERGVREVYIKLFRGRHGGRTYPRAYGRRTRRWLEALGLPRDERALFGGAHFIGRLCGAGQAGFSMGPDGALTRCDGVAEDLGNLIEGTARLGRAPRPCPQLHCTCPYQGLKWVTPERSLAREAAAAARWLARRTLRAARRAVSR